MNRKLIAGLFAAAILPATALAAHAKDFGVHATDAKRDRATGSTLTKTYPLDCSIGSDGESLEIRMNVRNTSGQMISKGTQIRIYVRTKDGTTAVTSEAYRNVPANHVIPLNKPPQGAVSCRASVTFTPFLKNKLEKSTRIKLPR